MNRGQSTYIGNVKARLLARAWELSRFRKR